MYSPHLSIWAIHNRNFHGDMFLIESHNHCWNVLFTRGYFVVINALYWFQRITHFRVQTDRLHCRSWSNEWVFETHPRQRCTHDRAIGVQCATAPGRPEKHSWVQHWRWYCPWNNLWHPQFVASRHLKKAMDESEYRYRHQYIEMIMNYIGFQDCIIIDHRLFQST